MDGEVELLGAVVIAPAELAELMIPPMDWIPPMKLLSGFAVVVAS